MGIGYHEAMEVYYKGGSEADIVERLTEWAEERWGELEKAGKQNEADVRVEFIQDRDLITDMALRYVDWALEEGLDEGYETVEVEESHYVQVPGAPCLLPVKFDLLQRNIDTGRLRIVDFKTRGQFYHDTTSYELSEQNGNYQLGVYALYGERPTELQYREARKMSPTLNPRSKPPYFRSVNVPLLREEMLHRAKEYARVANERFDPDHAIYSNPSGCCGSWKNDWRQPCRLVSMGESPEEALEHSPDFAPKSPYERYEEDLDE